MALTSFFSALTGLNANSQTINVIGDNLANLSTIGFKSGKATFAEIIGGMSGFSATGNPIVFGQGSLLNGIVHKQTPGTPEYTGSSTDAMLGGNGYFVIATGEGGVGYTRAGRFQFDSNGGLVSSDGYQLMGYKPDETGNINQTTGVVPLDIRMGQFVQAIETTEMSAAVNLDSQTPPNTAAPPAAADPGTAFVTSIEVFDSLGAQHVVQLTFTKTSAVGATPGWNMSAAVLRNDGLPADPMNITAAGGAASQTQALSFTANGTLDPVVPNSFVLEIPSGQYESGLPSNQITLHMRDSEGRSMITSAASESATSSTSQSGFAASTLESISFDKSGIIQGQSANGSNVVLGQLALATFPNVEGMQKYNGSTFIASVSAGEPSIGVAGSGGRSSVVGGSLEMSNVDMAEEFVNLIIAQRAYQANSRVITTSDELYMEAINLKR